MIDRRAALSALLGLAAAVFTPYTGPRAGTGRRDRVGDLGQDGVDRFVRLVAVVRVARAIDLATDKMQQHEQQKGADHAACDLVEFGRVHTGHPFRAAAWAAE